MAIDKSDSHLCDFIETHCLKEQVNSSKTGLETSIVAQQAGSSPGKSTSNPTPCRKAGEDGPSALETAPTMETWMGF